MPSSNNEPQFEVRKACAEDIPCIHNMLKELAVEQNTPNGPKLTVEDLLRDGGFNDDGIHPRYQAFVAELVQEDGVRRVIGHAICQFAYSTWEGLSLFLQSIYSVPDYRQQGIGRLLVKQVAQYAKEEGASRIDLHCLNYNANLDFYKKIGAANLTFNEDWHLFRLSMAAIDRLLAESC